MLHWQIHGLATIIDVIIVDLLSKTSHLCQNIQKMHHFLEQNILTKLKFVTKKSSRKVFVAKNSILN